MSSFKQRLTALEKKAKAKPPAPVVLVTPHPAELAYLAAIAAEPQEPVHRAAFTDWLEEMTAPSILRDTVVQFHREWVERQRCPKLRPEKAWNIKARWMWYRSKFLDLPQDCQVSILDPVLFSLLKGGAIWFKNSKTSTCRAYTTAALAEKHLLLAYLRRVNRQPVEIDGHE